MAVGDYNPVLENNKVYYDIKTGEARFGTSNRRKWFDTEKACVEPAPTTGGPYARKNDGWVDIGESIVIAKHSSANEGYTSVLLHFDDDANPYKDECGNIWVPTGNPTLVDSPARFGKALHCTPGNYLELPEESSIELGGKNFTIDYWFSLDRSQINGCTLQVYGLPAMIVYYTQLRAHNAPYWDPYAPGVSPGTMNHVALVYHHNEGLYQFYLNGSLIAERNITYKRFKPRIVIGDGWWNEQFSGTIDELCIVDGKAKWSESFSILPGGPYED